MATVKPKEGTPPPVIGKAGRYTVFLTPPATPRPSESPRTPRSPLSNSDLSPSPAFGTPIPELSQSPNLSAPLPPKAPPSPLAPTPPPVQVPPIQFDDPKGARSDTGAGGVFGFFWDAVAKIQNAHSSLDEYLADWFGLNQSRYQWALNDYYETKGMEKGGKPKDMAKGQIV